MQYTTLDIEFADVILPSIWSIAIIDWNEKGVINIYKTYINPECNIEKRFEERNILNINDLKKYPTLPEVWKDIFDRLENKIVFSHNANRNIEALKRVADIYYLNMPHFIYCCTASISKKLWPYLLGHNLPEVSEQLGISFNHYDAFEDAKTIGHIVNMAIEDTEASNLNDLFNKIGFSGGYVNNGKKQIYRAVKINKNTNLFLARIKKDETILELNLQECLNY